MADSNPLAGLLPPSLLLPTHLSAHKYFFVCTLTVAAWDTLVLTPRTWHLTKTAEWPLLKIVYHILRYLMPAEFIILAVAFFDTKWTSTMCTSFHLFEPIMTTIVIGLCSLALVIRLYAIHNQSNLVLGTTGMLLFLQVAAMGICSAFFRAMPLDVGQGCIAGPKHDWVGVYWIVPTVFYGVALALATVRSIESLKLKKVGPWKLMLRDGLNLYAAIFFINLVNILFWFIAQPTDSADTIKTIITSLATVLTTTMTMRIVLNVRGSLSKGGAYHGTTTTSHGSYGTNRNTGGQVFSTGGLQHGAHSNPSHIVSVGRNPIQSQGGIGQAPTFTLGWENREGVMDSKEEMDSGHDHSYVVEDPVPQHGVQVTVDREII